MTGHTTAKGEKASEIHWGRCFVRLKERSCTLSCNPQIGVTPWYLAPKWSVIEVKVTGTDGESFRT